MTAAILVEGVGKRFDMRAARGPSARQSLDALLRGAPPATAFWALRDVGFRIDSGEIVGVVGRNGAGKSVLLKLIARVMRPSCGRIEIAGRVAPLLEVGTGFHPDLTGRENIFLNGAILGMRRREVRARVDEIVEFADIGAFVDVPIKRYSSGMRMRLAFAVAAHLDRDIFLLDEVLTVGDKDYQAKCLDRLRTLAAAGRTILLVSHGAQQMERLCSRMILLDGGRLIADGTAGEVYRRYDDLGPRVAAG